MGFEATDFKLHFRNDCNQFGVCHYCSSDCRVLVIVCTVKQLQEKSVLNPPKPRNFNN